MPKVRKTQAAVVQGRVQRAQCGVEVAADQRRHGEGEGHREADVAHVEHRRVDDHARVLQQRVQVAAVGGGRDQAVEGVGGEQHEQQEAHRHQPHHRQDARQHRQRQAAAEQRHRRRSSRTASAPTAAASPRGRPRPRRCGMQRQRAVGVARPRRAPRSRCCTKAAVRQAKDSATSSEQHAGGRPRQRHPVGAAALRAGQRQRRPAPAPRPAPARAGSDRFRGSLARAPLTSESASLLRHLAAPCCSASAASGGM